MAAIVRGHGHAAVTQSPTNPDAPSAQGVALTDGENNILGTAANPLQTQAGSSLAPSVVRIEDGASTNLAAVLAFHNADNQSLPGSAFGVLTGGVAQAINPAGTLDRQRETGFDNVPGAGIVTGAQQLALPFTTTTGAGTITAGTRTITPAAMSGAVRGSAWTIQPGHTLSVDAGAAQEYVFVTATTATTLTAAFAKPHAAAVALSGFVYNQARDASAPDGSPSAGFGAAVAYFLNPALNGGAGGVESERSAAGELDGASGAGAAIAARYEHTSGGPALATGLATGLQFDRARNLQGKGSQTQAITSTGAGNTTLVFGSAAAANLLQPGAPVTLSGGAAQEVVYTSATWTPGSSATVPLQSPVVNAAQTLARFDVYAPQGPGLSGFAPAGIGVGEECVYDPVSGLYYLGRSATQDSMPGANIPVVAVGLWNGTSLDRIRGSNGAVNVLTQAAFPVYTESAVADSGRQASGNITGGSIPNNASLFLVSVSVTLLTATNVTYSLQVQDSNGNWVAAGSTPVITAAGVYAFSVGPGTANGNVLPCGNGNWRVSWTVTAGVHITSQIGVTGR